MICSGALSSDEVICGHVSTVRAAMAVIPMVEAVQSGFERGDGRGTFCSWGAWALAARINRSSRFDGGCDEGGECWCVQECGYVVNVEMCSVVLRCSCCVSHCCC